MQLCREMPGKNEMCETMPRDLQLMSINNLCPTSYNFVTYNLSKLPHMPHYTRANNMPTNTNMPTISCSRYQKYLNQPLPLFINPNFSLFLVNCEWSAWSWGACSKSCGGGVQSGHRTVSQQAYNGGTLCAGSYTTTRACNTDCCPGNHPKAN